MVLRNCTGAWADWQRVMPGGSMRFGYHDSAIADVPEAILPCMNQEKWVNQTGVDKRCSCQSASSIANCSRCSCRPPLKLGVGFFVLHRKKFARFLRRFVWLDSRVVDSDTCVTNGKAICILLMDEAEILESLIHQKSNPRLRVRNTGFFRPTP